MAAQLFRDRLDLSGRHPLHIRAARQSRGECVSQRLVHLGLESLLHHRADHFTRNPSGL